MYEVVVKQHSVQCVYVNIQMNKQWNGSDARALTRSHQKHLQYRATV